ncbi:helix-turn-helix domain-containing protein [Methylobacillus flagellatus]|uniref:Transcriptional regulator, AraC family n=1 Tax=Methylobacillus flagellatus (strain ATCC 51484 / DSM 6875 / VKM B-1610 / KT) TaxID=265072 RepID=Q1H3X7_METFK|nr:helix-turn-helix domain-containing protein [Methylobacillus flagellatus]ABE48810.1 transcriptional regulator, AraC family [Methylobacillus flagellatus KT]
MNIQEQFLGSGSRGSYELHLVDRRPKDVLEQAEALPFWKQDYTQLDKGAFSGAVTSVSCQGIQIFREKMNRAVDQLASAPADTYVIGLPTMIEGEATWGMLPVKQDSLITLNKNTELLFRTSHCSEIAAAVISAQRLEEYAALVEWVDLREIMRKVKAVEQISSTIANRLMTSLVGGTRYISDVHESASVKHMWPNFEEDLMSTCLQALVQAKDSINHHYDHRIHRYIVNRVRDFTLLNSCCPLTISELCIELRVSRRTLNHAFLRVLGITPVAYMRNVRLHRVRAELQSAPDSVTSIANVATKWGFWHMSLFSRYYRELFGECPNKTLERTRLHKA